MTKRIDLKGAVAFIRSLASEKNLNMLRSFFMGKWYPVWVAFSVLIGRFTGAEVYFAMLDFALLAVALLV